MTVLGAPNGRHDWLRWIGAAAVVVAVHGAVAAGLLLSHSVEPQGAADAPAVIVELAPLTVAPSPESVDAPPAPAVSEPEPEPEPPKPVEPEPEKPPLDIKPDEVVAPDLTIPLPREEPKQVEREIKSEPPPPKVKPEPKPEPPPPVVKPISKPEPKPEPKPAPKKEAAPPKAERKAAKPAAARIGHRSASALPPDWVQRLLAHLNRYKRYPGAARARGGEGVVGLGFTMDRHGHVLNKHIARSSGVAALDAEALDMLRRAEPLPAFPSGVTEATRSFTVPIRFSLR